MPTGIYKLPFSGEEIEEKIKEIDDKIDRAELDEYVKNTDYAAQGKPGVVNVDPTNFGIGAYPTSGILYITPASEAQIDAKTHERRPITPSNLDYAVKKGLADNKLEWTDDEKKAAREQIGVGIATYSTPGLVKPASWYGLMIENDGTIKLIDTQEAHINQRGNGDGSRVAITTPMLDYAVKKALTDPKNITWADTEKTSARELIGAIGTTDYPVSGDSAGVVKVSNFLSGLEVDVSGNLSLFPADE